MGSTAKSIGGALANIATFGGYGANKAAKKQASASNVTDNDRQQTRVSALCEAIADAVDCI